MFTDRYLRVPCKLYNAKQEELEGRLFSECDKIDISIRINPFKIEDYYPCIPGDMDFDESAVTSTRLVMESGERHLVYLTVDEFEKLLNSFANDR